MRIVRWSPQQRVDVPDKTAENFIALGEFRRLVRALIVGNDVVTAKIVRGFKVTAQSPVSAIVDVKLDPTGGLPLSVAVGAENMGSYLDWGHLIGDKDHFNALEGNATYPVDFTPQAPGTYSVWMTFVYTTGESNNRAFWNPATDAEFIAPTDTRHLPTLLVVASIASPGTEYAKLADVVWGGSTISAGNITDKRELIFEGAAPNSQSTQSGTGGIPDFDRTTPRADVTNDAIYTVLHKIGRQIQDIKGPGETGSWTFHARPIKPMDPSNVLAAGVTKSIATMDSLEFVVGDGTTTWGDFSGSNGLQLCLAHIQTSQAQLPHRIRIRLKSRRFAISELPIWTVTSGLILTTTKHIEVIADCAGTEQGSGRVPISWATGAVQFNFSASTASSLTLRNIKTANTSTASFFLGGNSGRIYLDNCYVYSQNVTIDANSSETTWRNSEVYGAVRLSLDTTYQAIDGLHLVNCRFGAATVQDAVTLVSTVLDGYLRFWRGASNLISSATTFASQVTATTCEFFYANNTLVADTSREACMDLRGASECVFTNCNFSTWQGSNGIALGNSGIDVANGSQRISFDSCRFDHAGTQTSGVSHDVDAGYGGIEGTGWSVYGNTMLSTATITSALIPCFMRNISFKNCTWQGCAEIDAGAVKLKNGMVNCSLDNCSFEGMVFTPDAGFTSLRRLFFVSFVHDAAYTNYDSASLSVTNCQFGRVSSNDLSANVPDIRHVNLGRVHNVHVTKCKFACSTQQGSSHKTLWSNGTSEYVGVMLNRVFDAYIEDCTFTHFPGTAVAASIRHIGNDLTLYASRFTIKNNHFQNSVYGFYMSSPSASLVTFEGNTFDADALTTGRMFKADTNLDATSVLRFLNNTVVNPPGSIWTVVQLGAVARVVFMGNDLSAFGRVIHDSGMPGFVVGWNTTPQMNLVAAWA